MMDILMLAAEAASNASQNSDLILAAISAIVAGLGVKLIDLFINRGSVRIDEAQQIRLELREEAKKRAEEISELKDELFTWKERYYDILHQYEEVKLELEMLRVIVNQNDRN